MRDFEQFSNIVLMAKDKWVATSTSPVFLVQPELPESNKMESSFLSVSAEWCAKKRGRGNLVWYVTLLGIEKSGLRLKSQLWPLGLPKNFYRFMTYLWPRDLLQRWFGELYGLHFDHLKILLLEKSWAPIVQEKRKPFFNSLKTNEFSKIIFKKMRKNFKPKLRN